MSVAIYDNRLETWSDGLLCRSVSPRKTSRRSHESRRRNSLIANVFYRRGSIEHRGMRDRDTSWNSAPGRAPGARVRSAGRLVLGTIRGG